MAKKAPATVAAIRKEMRVLRRLQSTAKTRHGAACALTAEQALRWALTPNDWPPPSAFVEVADAGAEQAGKRRR